MAGFGIRCNPVTLPWYSGRPNQIWFILALLPIWKSRMKFLPAIFYLGLLAKSSSGGSTFRSVTKEDVWTTTIPQLLTESAIRMLDVNDDHVDDVIMGFATGGDGYQMPDIVCDVYFRGQHPCFGGVMALDGISGKEIWRVYTKHEVFALNCNADLNLDGQKDCVAGGRAAVLLAIDARKGIILWSVNTTSSDLSNYYTPQILDDLNQDNVPEILSAHGGDPLRAPGQTVKVIGVLQILSGRTGEVLVSVPMPDDGESYYSPQVYDVSEGSQIVLFGSGGETHGGSLWAIRVLDLLRGDVSKAVAILTDPYKGVMVPPVLVDITQDGVVDIVMAMFNSSVIAIDGLSFREIWRYTIEGSETYSTPAAGYFNDDSMYIPDFFLKYSVGPGYPIYYHAEAMVIDGRTGQPLLKQPIRDIIGSQSSPLTVALHDESSMFLYWTSDCSSDEIDSEKSVPYRFLKGTRVNQQSRADFCKLRFGSSGRSRMYAISQFSDGPGSVLYDSTERKNLEHSNWVDTRKLAEDFLKLHPEWDVKPNVDHSSGKSKRRTRRHVGPHDDNGIQRLISTGTLTDSFETGPDNGSSIDLIFATYWFYPSETTIVDPKDQECIDGMMAKEIERFNATNRYYGMDHDAYENTVELECTSRRSKDAQKTAEPYRDLFHLNMGSMTVYRLRLRCDDGSKFLPLRAQPWAAYMGTRGDSLFHPVKKHF